MKRTPLLSALALILCATVGLCAVFAQGSDITVTLSAKRTATLAAVAGAASVAPHRYLSDRVDELLDNYAATAQAETDRKLEEKRQRVSDSVKAQVDAIEAKARADKKVLLDAVPDPTPGAAGKATPAP